MLSQLPGEVGKEAFVVRPGDPAADLRRKVSGAKKGS